MALLASTNSVHAQSWKQRVWIDPALTHGPYPGAHCGIAVPFSAIRHTVKQRIKDKMGGGTVEYTDDITFGSDDDTSEDDKFTIDTYGWKWGWIAVMDLDLDVRWVTGDPAFRSPTTLEYYYSCPGHATPKYYPNVWVTHALVWYTGLTEYECAGDGCSSSGSHAEEKRCDFQNELQDNFGPVSEQIFNMLDTILGSIYRALRLRATITSTTSGSAKNLVWRFPAVEPLTNTDILSQVQAALQAPENAELVQQYDVKIICDYGDTCAADSDFDGICDVEDCCPNTFNSYWNCEDDDNDGVPACADNCPETPNADWRDDQFDFDQDGIGNACDDDIDGDGVINTYDVNEYLPGLRWDLDQDGVADHWTSSSGQAVIECEVPCGELQNFLWSHYGFIPWPWWDLMTSSCLDLCHPSLDNCADGRGTISIPDFTQFDSDACINVYEILSDHRGPDPQEVEDFDTCKHLYSNPGQDPSNAVGMKCRSGAQEIVFEPIGNDSCRSPDKYRVAFTANAASVDESGELYQGSSIESCVCWTNWTPGATDWDPMCKYQDCNKEAREPWNPIRDQVFQNTEPGNPYPYWAAPSSLDAAGNLRRVFVGYNEMARDRQITFRRDSTQNRHEFTWPWQQTVRYPKHWPASPLDQNIVNPPPEPLTHTELDPKPVKVRIARRENVTSATLDYSFATGDVFLSDGVRYFRDPPPGSCPLVGEWLAFDRWWWIRHPYHDLDTRWDLIPAGWSMLESKTTGKHLVEFGRSLSQPTSVRQFTYLPGTQETVNLEGLSTTTGRMDASLLGQGYGKLDAVFAYGVPAGGKNRKLWIGLVGAQDNLWVTAKQIYGAGEGEVQNSPLFFDEQHQRLFVLGNRSLGLNGPIAPNSLTYFDFHTGHWVIVGKLDALGDSHGYSVSLDPLRRKVYFFGGEENGVTLDRILVMDQDTLTTSFEWKGAYGETWGRDGHGADFDPIDRTLYIYGGERNGTAMFDALAYRVVGRTWTPLWTGAQGGPVKMVKPLVRYDGRRRKLWVAADWTQGAAAEQLEPWELDIEHGQWRMRPSLSAPDPLDGGRESSFSVDAPPSFEIVIDDKAPLEGEVRLVELVSDDPNLELHVEDARGRPVASDERLSTDLQVVLFGQAGERYRVLVEAGPGFDRGSSATFKYLDRPATLKLLTDYQVMSDISGLVVVGDLAYVSHGQQVSVLSLENPYKPAMLGSVTTYGQVQEMVRCGGGYLCAVQTHGDPALLVLDIQQSGNPQVVGGLELAGACRSIAVHHGLAYVGCGPAVHQVNVRDPSDLQIVDTLSLPGPVVDVKARRGLLVVALTGKRIKLMELDTGSSPQVIGGEMLDKNPVQSLMIGERLHVSEVQGQSWGDCMSGQRCGFGSQVEVFALDTSPGAASLDLLGQYQGDRVWQPFAAGLGDIVLAPTPQGFQVYRAVPLK